MPAESRLQNVRFLLTLAFVIPMTVGSMACRPTTPRAASTSEAPAISVDHQEHDFGAIQAHGSVLRHTFTIKNTGADPVSINAKRIGCSCLEVACPDTVAAGASASVTVELEVRNREGPFATFVVISTSDPVRPEIVLRLQFHGVPRIYLDPPAIQAHDIDRRLEFRREFEVIASGATEEELSIKPVLEPASPAIRCEFLSSQPGGRSLGDLKRIVHRCRMTIDSSEFINVKEDRFTSVIHVRRANDASGFVKEIPIEIRFRHHSGLTGQTAATVVSGAEEAVHIRLWSRNGKPFSITRVESSIAEVAVQFSAKPEERQEVRVAAKPASGHKELKTGLLTVHTLEFPDEPYRVEVVLLP